MTYNVFGGTLSLTQSINQTGVEFWPIAPIFVVGFWSVCQGP